MKIKLIFLTLFAIGVLTTLFFFFPPQEKNQTKKIINLGRLRISMEVADTERKRSQGLSGRPSLSQDQGMLFIFSQKGHYAFWMKDMKFPLDFIWIDGETVVDLTKNVPYPKKNEPLMTLSPKISVDKVLEVNAGVVEKSGIKIGDQIEGL